VGQITVTQQEGYVEYHFIRVFDDVSLYQAVRELWTADDYEPTRQELYDLRGGDFTLISGTAIKKITDLNQQLHAEAPQLRHAMLATRDLFATRNRIMHKGQGSSISISYCRNMFTTVRELLDEGDQYLF